MSENIPRERCPIFGAGCANGCFLMRLLEDQFNHGGGTLPGKKPGSVWGLNQVLDVLQRVEDMAANPAKPCRDYEALRTRVEELITEMLNEERIILDDQQQN